jgi:photosystem II stability/assembly factor-like uncharacterized protein
MRCVTAGVVITAFLAFAQEQPPAPSTPAAVTDAPPAPQVLENRGKPIQLSYSCSADDIQWAGLSCAEDEPCAVFLELSAVDAVGTRILVTGNLHSESVTLYSVLLASEDGGRTWTEIHQRIRGAVLDHIQFLDANLGWISGEEMYPLPQNPFLLLTTDAGKTWTRRPVFNDAAEERFGSVQQFVFTDKDRGSLVVDRGRSGGGSRYVRFESRTGGASWNLVEESSRPPRMSVTAPPPAQWRLRADASARAYQVEHLESGRWSSIAAFAVKLPSCK